MFRKIAFLSFIVLLTFSCTQKNQQLATANVNTYIQSIKEEFVPDRRLNRFDVTATEEAGKIILRGETTLPEAYNKFKSQLGEIAVIDSITMLPNLGDNANKTKGVVNVSVCNIRSNPKHSAELSTQATLGTPLNIYKKEGDWFFVQTPEGYLGWLDPGGFEWMDDESFEEWQNSEKVIYLKDYGFSISTTDENAERVSDLISGNILQLVASKGIMSKVAYPDGRQAYIPSENLAFLSNWLARPDATVEDIISTATNYLGRPYLWGGTSGKGMDCSGFTKTVFFMNGYQLLRDASQQVRTGMPVEVDTTLANLQRGDLIFFGRKASPEQKERITHVAIYLGNGEIIHSSGSDNVCIQSLKRGTPNFVEERLLSIVRASRPLESPEEYGIPKVSEVYLPRSR